MNIQPRVHPNEEGNDLNELCHCVTVTRERQMGEKMGLCRPGGEKRKKEGMREKGGKKGKIKCYRNSPEMAVQTQSIESLYFSQLGSFLRVVGRSRMWVALSVQSMGS